MENKAKQKIYAIRPHYYCEVLITSRDCSLFTNHHILFKVLYNNLITCSNHSTMTSLGCYVLGNLALRTLALRIHTKKETNKKKKRLPDGSSMEYSSDLYTLKIQRLASQNQRLVLHSSG